MDELAFAAAARAVTHRLANDLLVLRAHVDLAAGTAASGGDVGPELAELRSAIEGTSSFVRQLSAAVRAGLEHGDAARVAELVAALLPDEDPLAA
ncbi:MAG TPA: hypothetical protein VFB42_11030 [Gaiellaceae bacterium]|nr:hypothetical protein [Gaiellaceae bacterium]